MVLKIELHAEPPVAPLFLMAETSSNPEFKALEPAPAAKNDPRLN